MWRLPDRFTKEAAAVARYLYTIKSTITGETLFAGGEGAAAQFLDCNPTYMSVLGKRSEADGKGAKYGDFEVSRTWEKADLQCRQCGAMIYDAKTNQRYCSRCAKERIAQAKNKGIAMQELQDDGTHISVQEKQRRMQEPCRGCIYFGGENYLNASCNYIFIVGHSRGCPPGDGCTVRKGRKQ